MLVGNLEFVIGFLSYGPAPVADSLDDDDDDDSSFDLLPVIVGAAAALCVLLVVIIAILVVNARRRRNKTVTSAYLEARLSQYGRRVKNGRYVTGDSLRQNGHAREQDDDDAIDGTCTEYTVPGHVLKHHK